MSGSAERPRLVVFSSLFPSPAQPNAGVFVRERMFRVGQVLPVTVVSPQPWFPLQSLIRRFVPRYRPPAPGFEVMDAPSSLCLTLGAPKSGSGPPLFPHHGSRPRARNASGRTTRGKKKNFLKQQKGL